ncbi:membrane-spanning 4-domains subfamily A member 4A-like [Scomber japonicus]|uniref:membrane-spanning 4-domains subfamily A member 4A-like n=1 Tax=Scomber japonicus TaxID=13676 RepID=UPI00230630FA|nr:membrane-spanning 4-domains subfamily A member 4A-like [Scomber japonicus]XP_053183871.1 membrane-spanning 4-domains subfamily A member 4A-like [Scomber japonicus]
MFPPLYQIPKALCRHAERCSVYERLMQTSVTTAFGTLQIMVGLFNIGLGPGRPSLHPGDLTNLGAAYWLGAVFIVTGVMTILAGQFPSSGLVGFTVFMNICGAIFAITAIVLYAIDLSDSSFLWMCDLSRNNDQENCRNVAFFAQRLLRSMDITLIAVAVLQLCVNIRFSVLGIKALCEKEREGGRYVEDHQAELKDVPLVSPGA